MDSEIFDRNTLFWGKDNQNILKTKNIAVFGLGGVGGYCAETLARAGICNLTIIDFDKVSQSNINRQIIALNSTIGEKKTDLFKNRLKDINPDINIRVIDDFYNNEEIIFDFTNEKYDYVADAIDTMRSKISLLENCYKNNIPVISSMGAGNRIDPTKLYISDIKDIENKNAPFVSNVIYQLKKLGITEGITVVKKKKKPFVQNKITENEKIITNSGLEIEFNKIIPSSTPFVAPVAGIYMAYHIVNSLIKEFK